MKSTLLTLATLASFSLAHADLIITEVMSSSGHTTYDGDWFELTNNGTNTVNLNGYYWDDNGANGDDGAAFPNVSIAAGESIVIVDDDAENLAAFISSWGGGFTALSKDEFSGPDDFSGLSSGGDQIEIWDADPNTNASANLVAAASFGAATDGVSFEWDNTGNDLGLSVVGQNGAFLSSDATPDTASPGHVITGGSLVAPSLEAPFEAYWRVNLPLSALPFTITATDPNAGESIDISSSGTPAWLTVTDAGDGTATLSGMPSIPGAYSFDITATDDSGVTGSTTESYTLYIYGDNNPVLLNEYNGVADDNFLNGGDESTDGDGGAATDSYFGRVLGNGEDWFELVVVGNGSDGSPVEPVAGSTVDMRQWSIEIHSAGEVESIELSDDDYWAAVPAGTILTFTENNSAQGGLDTELNRVSQLSSTGYIWSNVWIHDPFLVDAARSSFGDGIVIDNDNTQFILKNATGELMFGPAGEGIPTVDSDSDGITDTSPGVNNEEIYKLEQDPEPAVDARFGAYNDGGSSTFGSPNKWSSGASSQDFSPYISSHTPPKFDSLPVKTSVGGAYSYSIVVSDPDGGTPTLTADSLPSFLTLSGNTLSANRTLTLADAGEHVVALSVGNGTYNTPQRFILTVYNPSPAVILNEYNAVDNLEYLNGGDANSDDDTGIASDVYFGRVPGNGGDWFELIVLGDGSAGTTDLRGYQIQVGTPQGDGSLDVQSTLVLSDDSTWSSVENGTILTFTEDNSANGGLDTGVKIVDNRSTNGWIWTNVWLGDSVLLDYSDEASNGYDLSALPDVSGLGIDEEDTQFRILDAAGQVVFGTVGEGIAPLAGVSANDIFELEKHPSLSITPLDDAQTDPDELGYDDGANGSTFGAPNNWHLGSGGSLVYQDFSAFITEADPYDTWIDAYALTGEDALPDSDYDADGYTNLEEYLFAGNPADREDAPFIAFDPLSLDEIAITVRTDDNDYTVYPQWSRDLVNWYSSDFILSSDEAASKSGHRDRVWRNTLSDESKLFYRFKAE
jgi:hypothetical protein